MAENKTIIGLDGKPLKSSKITKLQETNIYHFFKGIPPLSTVAFSILSVSLFFVVKFLYYLYQVGFLTEFGVDISYVDFSEVTYLKIALTTVISVIETLFFKVFSSVYSKSVWKGFGLTCITLFACFFILLFKTAKLSSVFIISVVCVSIIMVIPFIICIAITIKNKLKKVKKTTHHQSKILKKFFEILGIKKIKNKLDNLIKKINRWFLKISTGKHVFIVFIIIMLASFYYSGIAAAEVKQDFKIIDSTDKQYAVISEYKDRFICVECDISNDGKTMKLHYETQKQISITGVEYKVCKFDKVE